RSTGPRPARYVTSVPPLPLAPPPEVPRACPHRLPAARSRRRLAGGPEGFGPPPAASVAAPASHQRDTTGLYVWRQLVEREPGWRRRTTTDGGAGYGERGSVLPRRQVGGVHRGV